MNLLCLHWDYFTTRLLSPPPVLQIGLHPASTGSLHRFWGQFKFIALRILAERAIRKSSVHSRDDLLPLSYLKMRTGKEIMLHSGRTVWDISIFPQSSLFQLSIQILQRMNVEILSCSSGWKFWNLISCAYKAGSASCSGKLSVPQNSLKQKSFLPRTI